jgi:hypothetical protein
MFGMDQTKTQEKQVRSPDGLPPRRDRESRHAASESCTSGAVADAEVAGA